MNFSQSVLAQLQRHVVFQNINVFNTHILIVRYEHLPLRTVFVARERHFVNHTVQIFFILVTYKELVFVRIHTVFHILHPRHEYFKRIGRMIGRDIARFGGRRTSGQNKNLLSRLTTRNVCSETCVRFFINQLAFGSVEHPTIDFRRA